MPVNTAFYYIGISFSLKRKRFHVIIAGLNLLSASLGAVLDRFENLYYLHYAYYEIDLKMAVLKFILCRRIYNAGIRILCKT